MAFPTWAGALTLLWSVAQAQTTFRHPTLNISFPVPAGWTTSQGPAAVETGPAKDLKGERRPKLRITVENPPPTFEDFDRKIRQSVKEKGQGRSYQLKAVDKANIAECPARTYRYVVVEKGHGLRSNVNLVRLSKFYGFLVSTECMEVDAKVAEPIFAGILKGLRLGPPR